MALSQSALSELLDAFRTGDGVDMIRESVRTVLQELVEFEAAGVIGADRYERSRGPGHRTQRHPPEAVGDQGRRHRAADPETAEGLVLPVHPRTPPPDRPGPVCGGDGGLRPRRLDPQRRRSRGRARRRLRHLQVRGVSDLRSSSTRSSAHSAPGLWTTSGFPTSISTRPTCTCATSRARAARSCRWPSWSPPGSPPTAPGRSWASTSATARTRRSGVGSCSACDSAAWPGCSWSSPTNMPGW